MPRRSHGTWEPSSARPDPIDLLEQQAAMRVPELVPIRHGRMLVSPFAFFRGAALIMASDLASTPRSGIRVQLCGDAHLSNFGVFGTPERRLVFDVSDFDETSPGPWGWDVKRLAASIVVAGRQCGFSSTERLATVLAAVSEYRTTMRSFARMSNLGVWHAHLDVDQLLKQRRTELSNRTIGRTKADLAKARTRDSLRALSKLTKIVAGEPRIINRPPLIVPIEELLQGIEHDRLQGMAALCVPRLLGDAASRSLPAARAVPARPFRAQGDRRRQRRHQDVDRAVSGSRYRRPTVPPD